ncbi:thioredoxin domain-containing protein [Nocardiopsis suaedae]|uniref:Terminase small subunit n=1 Tax=Nocardiopsis suaedae TaxID=3018444 RepID=A0ABT4TMT7_9ACTN|nr:hypothetical protein [Nocardiopsis suaedae]MDA2805715.1 hypothetical protein [Nocardiopsis suaedae]
MPRGGARVTSGPPPDPNALRRTRPGDSAGWKTLPPSRTGAPPAWPLTDVQPREWDLWRDLWSRPQAVMWEEMGQTYEVALLVRNLGEAEQPGARADVQKVVRQYMDSLGLTVQGMLRNRWKVADAPDEQPAGEEAPAPTGAKPQRRSARDRLKVVTDGEGA